MPGFGGRRGRILVSVRQLRHMATTSGDESAGTTDQPPEVIHVGDEERIELAFRDERVADEDAFVMPDRRD